MARILVTGASGFVGRHLVPLLYRQGHQVRCFVRPSSHVEHLTHLDVELVHGTLEDPAALRRAVEGVQCVYHLAALTSARGLARLLQVNGGGTANVARACAEQSDPPTLIYCSSIAAAGPISRNRVRTERDPARPISHYGHSKRAGELVVERFAHIVPTTIVRPGIVFGEWNRELLLVFRCLHWLRMHAVPGAQSPKLSFIFSADLVRLLVAAAARGQRLPPRNDGAPTEQGYYFACAPEYPDYFQFGRMLRQVMDRPHAWLLHFPDPFPWLMAGVYESASRLFGALDSFNIDKMREAMAENWACSPAAAIRDLQFQPSAPLLEQLRHTAQWYRENRWL